VKTLILTSPNLAEMKYGIPVTSIPRTYLDAMRITKSLGVDYIWSDSLCIMQDSEEDWAKQAAEMAFIYANSDCAIAAAVGDNAQHGCYSARNSLSFAPCRIAGNETKGLYAHAKNIRPGGSIEDMGVTSALFKRAWVYQERILSPKVLYFGQRGIAFNCKLIFASETDVDAKTYPLQPEGGFESALWHTPQTSLEWIRHNHVSDPGILHDIWFGMVTEYSQLAMTEPGDKLVALAGLASRVWANVGGEYLAGLWHRSFALDALWFVVGQRYPRPNGFRAPSWSWASVEGTIVNHELGGSFTNIVSFPVTKITNVKFSTHPRDTRQVGAVSGSYLSLRGRVKRAPSSKDVP
jgi:hypothetical protein